MPEVLSRSGWDLHIHFITPVMVVNVEYFSKCTANLVAIGLVTMSPATLPLRRCQWSGVQENIRLSARDEATTDWQTCLRIERSADGRQGSALSLG